MAEDESGGSAKVGFKTSKVLRIKQKSELKINFTTLGSIWESINIWV